eukprot:scaffold87602_cov27-Tisochrysis_lutea.AAC.7
MASVVIHWESEDARQRGQVYAAAIRVGSHFAVEAPSPPTTSLFSRPSPPAGAPPDPEALAAAVSLAIVCDMSTSLNSLPLSLLPVALHLRNRSNVDLAYNFLARAEGSARQADVDPPIELSSGGHAAWLGVTKVTAEWLPAGGHAELNLHAALVSTGTVVLEGLSVVVCGWRDAVGTTHWLSQPACCATPLPRRVAVTA